MRTVMFSYVISSVICATVMALLWQQNRRRSPELGFWLADFIMQFTGLLLVGVLRGILPDFFSMVLSNTLIIGGSLLLFIGLERYTGKTGPQWYNTLYLVVFILVQMVFVYVQPSLLARNINVSLGLLFICTQCAWLLLHRVGQAIRPDTRMVGVVFGVFSLVSLVRIFVDLVAPPANDFFKSGLYDSLVMLTYQMLYIWLTLALFLMVDRRLLTALESDISERELAEAALKISEEKFSIAFQNIPDAVVVVSFPDGKITEANASFFHLSGYDKEESLGRTTVELDLWGSLAQRNEFMDALQKQRRVLNWEAGFRKKSGELFSGLISGEFIQLQGQTCLLNVIHDNNERKRNELIQRAIYRIAQTTITADGIDALYQSIHSILGELIPAENFFIAIYASGNGLISFPYYIDQYDEAPSEPTQTQGLTGYVIRTGRTLLATRETFDRLVQQGKVEAVGTVSVEWLGVPLKVERRTIGVICVQSYTQGIHFNQDDVNLLEFISAQVAQAIDRKRLEEEIRNLSLTDELTGLLNRRGLALLAEQEIKLAKRKKRTMLLLFGDVDHLKTINDTFGHSHGDLALKEVSAILKKTFREADILARIGGDEFVVLMLDASKENAEIMTDRIQTALETRNQQRDKTYHLTLSIGVARYDPMVPCTLSELIAQADDLMYQQKHYGNGEK
jgi:diguanylate cyclase (GGDEF)-like protein/PAS domain S-box-containing protein